tara:strand:+ start:2882 stop:3274 length:393 start_codon:yes stop_codon:yes gene_type:complete
MTTTTQPIDPSDFSGLTIWTIGLKETEDEWARAIKAVVPEAIHIHKVGFSGQNPRRIQATISAVKRNPPDFFLCGTAYASHNPRLKKLLINSPAKGGFIRGTIGCASVRSALARAKKPRGYRGRLGFIVL